MRAPARAPRRGRARGPDARRPRSGRRPRLPHAHEDHRAYPGRVLLASHLAAAALAGACPPSLATGIATPAATTQLVTVEASVAATTQATLRIWRRADGCWRA